MAVPKYDEESQNFSVFFCASIFCSLTTGIESLPLSFPTTQPQGFQFAAQSQGKALHSFLNPIQYYLLYKMHIITLLSPSKLSSHWDSSPAQPHHTGNW